MSGRRSQQAVLGQRYVFAWTVVVLSFGALAIVGNAQTQSRTGSRGLAPSPDTGQSAADAIRDKLIIVDGPARSIGDTIDASAAVVRATVLQVAQPRWNSEDGHDWRSEYEETPDAFDTSPLPFTTVTLRVLDVYDVNPSSNAPALAVGDQLEVNFRFSPSVDFMSAGNEPVSTLDRARFLAAGDERVFFLERRAFPFPKGLGPEVWRVDERYGYWGTTPEGQAFPIFWDHIYSLKTAGMRGYVESTKGFGIPVSIDVDDLIRVIRLERQSPTAASVASYLLWPIEPGYRAG